MNHPQWISRSKPVDFVSVDVGFLVEETFYYGPDNGFSEQQWQQLQEPLYQPQVERYGDYVLSEVLGESAAELMRYYQDVIRLAARHRKEILKQLSYFWMRPVIFARGIFEIAFPWYDTWEEAVPVLDALTSTSEGFLFQDTDQGWEFQVFAAVDRLFLRQGDFDSGEEHCVIATSRATIADQVPAVRQRVDRLLQQLSTALGRDYWSHRSLG